MARRIAAEAPVPTGARLPPELAVFVFAAWNGPEDGHGRLVDDFGPLGTFLAAEGRWRAAVAAWGESRGLTPREARELVTRRPAWPSDYLGGT